MKLLFIPLAIFYSLSTVFTNINQVSAQEVREQIPFNESWKFRLGDISKAKEVSFNDSDWRIVDLPHDWSIEAEFNPSLASCTGYLPGGIGWYRKNFKIPSNWDNKKVLIYFEGIYENSEVWINGHYFGKRPNGYISFFYDLSPYILPGENNLISVRVDHTKYADSRWYTGSGIYRTVKLIVSGKTCFAPWGIQITTPVVTKDEAIVRIKSRIEKSSTKESKLHIISSIVSGGKELARIEGLPDNNSGTSNISELHLKTPNLWDIDHPYLYELITKLYDGNLLIDEVHNSFGLRSFRFDANKGFFLNEKSMKIKGVCLHQDGGCLGAAVLPKIWWMRLKKLKEAGCNAIRTSHNPVSPEFLDLCDSLGFIVMEEAYDEWEYPKRKWINGWDKTIAWYDGSYSFFNDWSIRDLADLIKRDINHPSIIMWSIGNEIDYANDPYADPGAKNYSIEKPDPSRMNDIASSLIRTIKEIDTSRPVTMALADIKNSNIIGLPELLDIVGYNYTESQYEDDHIKYPKRIIYGSENPHTYEGWLSVINHDYISAQFLWTGIDYLGEANPFPARSAYSGLLDLTGKEKSIYYWRQSMWSDKPMISIFARKKHSDDSLQADPMGKMAWFVSEIEERTHWNYKEGDTILVMAYTNCNQAELFLNGKSLGNKIKNDKYSCIWWYIPFKQGELSVIGRGKDGSIQKANLKTISTPASVQLSPDVYMLASGDKGIVIVNVELKDKNGNEAVLSDKRVDFSITGEGKILGTDNGDASCIDNFKLPWRKTYLGHCMLVLQSSGKRGKITLQAASSGLPSTSIEILIK